MASFESFLHSEHVWYDPLTDTYTFRNPETGEKTTHRGFDVRRFLEESGKGLPDTTPVNPVRYINPMSDPEYRKEQR